jgi:hypothetical protein
MSYCHLDLVVASLVDFVCQLNYSFFIYATLFIILVFFVALVITYFLSESNKGDFCCAENFIATKRKGN